MNIETQVTLIKLALASIGASLLFTSLVLMAALLWTDALYAGLWGALSLGLFCLLHKFQQ